MATEMDVMRNKMYEKKYLIATLNFFKKKSCTSLSVWRNDADKIRINIHLFLLFKLNLP